VDAERRSAHFADFQVTLKDLPPNSPDGCDITLLVLEFLIMIWLEVHSKWRRPARRRACRRLTGRFLKRRSGRL
jgi:hypothetical protein